MNQQEQFVNEFICPCNNKLIKKNVFKRHIYSKIHKEYLSKLTYNTFPISQIYVEIKEIVETIEKKEFDKLLKYYIELRFNAIEEEKNNHTYTSYLHYVFYDNKWTLENYCEDYDYTLPFILDCHFSDGFSFFYFLEWDGDYHTKFDKCKDYTYWIHKTYYDKSKHDKKQEHKRDLVKTLCAYFLNTGIINVCNFYKLDTHITRSIIDFII
jgi:hypothetical protein